ncbi:hypothetical protein [Clostridium baratii]
MFELKGDEDVVDLASRDLRMNRYYGINLKYIAIRRALSIEFRYFKVN